MQFSTGAKVTWVSSAGGFDKRKEGVVVAVISAGALPSREDYPSLHKKGLGSPRDHVSYVVLVEGAALYWPRTRHLAAV
jgi:hypothetical protein